jgi:hypothetical protein
MPRHCRAPGPARCSGAPSGVVERNRPSPARSHRSARAAGLRVEGRHHMPRRPYCPASTPTTASPDRDAGRSLPRRCPRTPCPRTPGGRADSDAGGAAGCDPGERVGFRCAVASVVPRYSATVASQSRAPVAASSATSRPSTVPTRPGRRPPRPRFAGRSRPRPGNRGCSATARARSRVSAATPLNGRRRTSPSPPRSAWPERRADAAVIGPAGHQPGDSVRVDDREGREALPSEVVAVHRPTVEALGREGSGSANRAAASAAAVGRA